MLINELTLNENSNKMIGANETIYLLRQLIKKYSRNNILNAIYDFISEKDNSFMSSTNDNNLINSTTDSSLNKLLNSQSDSKCEFDSLKKIQEKKNEEEIQNNDLIKNEGNTNNQLLSKKRKLDFKSSDDEDMLNNKGKSIQKYPIKKK